MGILNSIFGKKNNQIKELGDALMAHKFDVTEGKSNVTYQVDWVGYSKIDGGIYRLHVVRTNHKTGKVTDFYCAPATLEDKTGFKFPKVVLSDPDEEQWEAAGY